MIDSGQRWALAKTALVLLKTDPSLKGICVKASYGPVQQAFIDALDNSLGITRLPVSISAERLQGGIDIAQTLSAGCPVFQAGLLQTQNSALLVSGAERLETITASILTAYLDEPDACVKNHNVLVLMDESEQEESGVADSALADQLAFMLELPDMPFATLQGLVDEQTQEPPIESEALPAMLQIDAVELPENIVQDLVKLTDRLGISSMRALLFAVRVAKVHAAYHQRLRVDVDDVAIAAQLVLAPRATQFDNESTNEEEPQDKADTPPPESEESSEPPCEPPAENETPEEPDDEQIDPAEQDMGEQLLEAVEATLPQHLIADLARGQINNRTSGRDAGAAATGRSGRPAGVRRPRGGLRDQRLNIVETLKAAAPKQRLRGNSGGQGQRLQVRLDDFRITHYKQPTRTTTVFVVDASGSAALHRLAEAKGAVELLLAECYVRRDRVAMISFRGSQARLELPPTRSLVRAKRELANLPGGGGTPLAAGLDMAAQVAQQLKQAGEAPVLVIMTDGKANIARDGTADRAQAMDDAHQAARNIAAMDIKCLFVDTAPRARAPARELAQSLNARYLPLPSLKAQTLPDLISA